MSTKSNDAHRTSLSNISESPELLSRRRARQSPRKRTRKSARLIREEIQYQRFIKDLKRDVQFHLKQSIQENRFDTRLHPTSKTTPSNQFSRSKKRASRSPSSLATHRSVDTETIVAAIRKQQDPTSLLRQNQKQRIEADVRTILSSPAMKLFYEQFIRPLPKRIPQTKEPEETLPFVESFFNVS